jgi:hypothetical protein
LGSQNAFYDRFGLGHNPYQNRKLYEKCLIPNKEKNFQKYKCDFCHKDGHLEAFCFKKKERKQVFYRTPEHSQNGLRNRNFRKPVHRHSLNTLRRDVYKRTPYKRSSYSQRIPYKKFETNTQGPKKLWVPKNLLNSNVGMPSSSQEKALVLGQWMLKTYDRR